MKTGACIPIDNSLNSCVFHSENQYFNGIYREEGITPTDPRDQTIYLFLKASVSARKTKKALRVTCEKACYITFINHYF